MPPGDKDAYTAKQKRKAAHIEEGYLEAGVAEAEAEARAWATVNAQDGGGKLSGSGRKKTSAKKTSAKKTSAKKTSAKKTSAKKTSAKKTSA